MTVLRGPELPDPLRRIVADAWRFRWQVELEAEVRFARLAVRLARVAALPLVIELANRASADERRHASLCAQLALAYGAAGINEDQITAPEIAPARLSDRDRVLYEVVAACCITETESMSVLTTLIASARHEPMLAVLRELARDEVSHSRLGWAHLAHEQSRRSVAFLGPLVPRMLEGTLSEDFFSPGGEQLESPELLQHGVLPRSTKRSVFVGTLRDVVFPGLQGLGVDTAPAREWLRRKEAA